MNVNLGFDFVTDMLVLEFSLDPFRIDCRMQNQQQYISPLRDILKEYGCNVRFTGKDITANTAGNSKELIVYSAMWAEPCRTGSIFVSDVLLKLAKPYALQKILDEANK